MQNSRNDPLMFLLLVAAAAIVALAACTGDDDDGGISLSQSDATATPEATVPLDVAGTVPAPPGFAQAFAELRAEIEAGLESSPLSDDTQIDELVAMCDGGAVGGEDQFQACIELLEVLAAQDTPELQRLIDLTAEHAANEFPDRQSEIDAAAGLDDAAEPTTEPTDMNPDGTSTAGTVPIG